MSITIVGTCSLCYGRVVVPTVWCGTIPPSPQCEKCGALAVEGPLLPMKPSPQIKTMQSFGDIGLIKNNIQLTEIQHHTHDHQMSIMDSRPTKASTP